MGSNIPFPASGQRNIFFTPTMINSLSLWFDASDPTTITQSAGAVSQWRDKSSNAYSVSQDTTSNQPTYTTNLLNGLPGIQLSGTRYLYQIGSSMPNFTSGSATTVYMVAKNGSSIGNGWNIINTVWFTGVSGGTTRYYFSFGYGATNGITLYTNGAPVANPSSLVVPYNTNAIIGFAASATSNYIFYNGSNTSYASSAAPPTANNSTWFIFGDARVSPTPVVTDENIYEFVGFNTVLTTSQQQLVEGYLATKWGLQSSLSNGHPFKITPLLIAPSLLTSPPYPTSAISNPEFDPRLIPGCDLWLDAQDIFGNGTVPSNGATISTWFDKSGAGNTLTGVNTPTYSTNAVNLSSTAYLSNATPTDSANTMFFVYNTNSGNLGPLFCTQATTDVHGFFPNWATTGLMYIAQADGAWYSATSLLPNQQVNIVTVQYNGGNGSAINVWYNSSNIISTTQTNTITRSVFVLGARLNNGPNTNYFQGQFYEVITYNQVLATTQRYKIEAYLAKKWNLKSVLNNQNIYSPGSYLSFTTILTKSNLPMRLAVQNNRFFPNQLTNCVLWLDAADVNGTGRNPNTATITSWTDKSGAGNNSTASGGTVSLTANALNNRPGVSFSAASSSYIQVPRVITNDWSIFILFTTTQTGPNSTPTPGPGQSHTDSLANHWWGGQGIFDAEVAGTQNDFGFSLCGSPSAYLSCGLGDLSSATDTTEFSSTVVNTGGGFIGESFRTQSSGNLQMYVNGAFQVSTTASTAARNTTNIKIGSIQTTPAGYYFTGNIYEIICYTRVLTVNERQQVEGYLAWKWGLRNSLSADHPCLNIPPVPLP